MKVNESLYFIAIVPPEPLCSSVMEIKNTFARDYNSKAALRSPPHLTLHMPFRMSEEKLERLGIRLKQVLKDFLSFEVELSGFGAFPPKVIYIRITESDPLTELHLAVKRLMRTEFSILNQDYKDQGFHPHLTVAFRDLKKSFFRLAWDKYEKLNFNGNFSCKSVFLLKHNGKIWEKYREIALLS